MKWQYKPGENAVNANQANQLTLTAQAQCQKWQHPDAADAKIHGRNQCLLSEDFEYHQGH